jgi:hypothetical protein
MRGWGALLHAAESTSATRIVADCSGSIRSGRDVSLLAEPRRAIDRETSIVVTNRESSALESARHARE